MSKPQGRPARRAHVAVTGASSGIGEALVREFARAGADVTLVARRKDVLERIAAELPRRSFVATHDLADPAHAADWIPAAEAALGPIDILISNAGFLTIGPTGSFDPDEGDRMTNLNFVTPVRLMRTVLPGMLARRAGVIVNVTSVAALVSTPGWAWQAASKAASATFRMLPFLWMALSGLAESFSGPKKQVQPFAWKQMARFAVETLLRGLTVEGAS